LLDLRTFVKPDEVEIFAAFLLLLYLDCPQTFNTLCLVSSWGVVMPFMGVDFGEEGILLAGFGVCWRFKRPQCTLD